MPPNRIIALVFGAIALIASLSSFAATIHEVVRNGDVQAVSNMIATNRNLVNVRNELGSTPLHIAAGIPGVEMTRLLIDKGAVINVKDNGGATPLHIAAFSGKKMTLDLLIAKGADIMAKDNQGKTARDYAETTLNHEIADTLLIKMLSTPKSASRK